MKTIVKNVNSLLATSVVRTCVRQFFCCCLLVVMLLLNSCGEIFDVDESGDMTALKMTLSRDSLYIMPGDSLRLSVTFEPETAGQMGTLWLVDNPDVACLCSDTIVASKPGVAIVTVASADFMCLDTCVVNVMEPWVVDRSDFFYDTVVYADVSVAGRGLADGIIVGAFVDDELRGMATSCESGGKNYAVIRVYGPVTASTQDVITFKCYDRREVRVRSFDVQLPFDGESHGTLSQLVELRLD